MGLVFVSLAFAVAGCGDNSDQLAEEPPTPEPIGGKPALTWSSGSHAATVPECGVGTPNGTSDLKACADPGEIAVVVTGEPVELRFSRPVSDVSASDSGPASEVRATGSGRKWRLEPTRSLAKANLISVGATYDANRRGSFMFVTSACRDTDCPFLNRK